MPAHRVYEHRDALGHPLVSMTCMQCAVEYLGRNDRKGKPNYCSLRCAGKASNPGRPHATHAGHLMCVGCGQEKPVDAFSLYGRSETGRRPRCRTCRAEEWQTTGKKQRASERGRVNAMARERYRANPDVLRGVQHRRRAQKHGVHAAKVGAALMAAKWSYWGGLCWMCKAEAVEWDHVRPLSKGGAHMLANLRPACRDCNVAKGDVWPFPTLI